MSTVKRKVCILLTCFNRKDKTVNCIKSLLRGSDGLDLEFIVVDDNSLDGTVKALQELEANVLIYHGDGNLFYSGGMNMAMDVAKKRNAEAKYDFFALVNDDVLFDDGALQRIIENCDDKVIVGAMRDTDGNCSYGGIKYDKGIHYHFVTPADTDRNCDTFNANCVVIPGRIFMAVPIMDKAYKHSLGDFDYGLSIKHAGYPIEVSDHFAGTCNDNPPEGGWTDRSLSRLERIRQKESIKGAPFKPWFHFLRKNFGVSQAIVSSLTPYVRILLGL